MEDKYKSFENFADSYFNIEGNILDYESKILAMKDLLLCSPEISTRYLPTDLILDGINYQKKFKKTKRSYNKYLDDILFDTDPRKVGKFMRSLKSGSEMATRLIAARLLEEYSIVKSQNQKPKDEIYLNAYLYRELSGKISGEEAIIASIFELLKNKKRCGLIKVLGQDAFLDYLNHKETTFDDNREIVENKDNSFSIIYHKLPKYVFKKDGEIKKYFISKKLAEEHFPVSELKKWEMCEEYKEHEECDEESDNEDLD